MSNKDLAKTAVLTILEELDYDIYKQFENPAMSEDPEFTLSQLNVMTCLMENVFKQVEPMSDVEPPSDIVFDQPLLNEPHGWYVSVVGQTFGYLHDDGKVHFSTTTENTTGYFKTVEEATAVIEKYNHAQ